MVKTQSIRYGSDAIQVHATKLGFTLMFGKDNKFITVLENVSVKEIMDYIKELRSDLFKIEYQFESTLGVFKDCKENADE